MKFFTTSLLFLLSVIVLQGQDYFWVGNGGNWSDLNHWVTSSGGTTLHTQLPGHANNVIFDENSFTLVREEVIMDLDSMLCHDLIVKNITLEPKILGDNYYTRLFIHGDLNLSGNYSWGITQNYIVGEVETTISVIDEQFGGFLIISPEDSLAKFTLARDFNVGNIEIYNGQLDLNGFDLNSLELRIGIHSVDGAPLVLFRDSKVRSSRFIVHEKGKLDAGTSEITIYQRIGNGTNLFFGEGHNFHHVNFEGEIDRISGNNYFNEFRVAPASSLAFEDGEVQTAGQFFFEGTSSAPISIFSRKEGIAAILHQESGVVNGNYLTIKDNTTSGAAIFNAFNSIDNGNVTGWNIEKTAIENYFWIGGAGEWSDLGHWSKTSGGNANHIELPSAIDNVFFDNKSITEENAIIEIDLDAILINNFSSVGLKLGTELRIKQGSEGKIGIYGDISHGTELKLNFKEIDFLGDSIQTISTNNAVWGYESNLKFISSAVIELEGDLEAGDISISNGHFKSNGYSIETYKTFKLSKLDGPLIDLSNSEIRIKSWLPSGPDVNLINDNTKITCSAIFYGENFKYNKVDFTGNNWVYGPMYIEDLTFSPGSEILIFPGDTIKFTELSALGNSTDSIRISSREEGSHAYLYSESGTVNGEFLVIKDNHAIGGAAFIAENSKIEENSVIGWNGIVSDVINFPNQKLIVYPNPSSNYFWISSENIDLEKLMIYNSSGQKVEHHFQNNKGSDLLRIETTNWPEGVYFLSSNNSLFQQKIVIIKN